MIKILDWDKNWMEVYLKSALLDIGNPDNAKASFKMNMFHNHKKLWTELMKHNETGGIIINTMIWSNKTPHICKNQRDKKIKLK